MKVAFGKLYAESYFPGVFKCICPVPRIHGALRAAHLYGKGDRENVTYGRFEAGYKNGL